MICLFTMKTFGVNFLILLYENVYNIVAYASSKEDFFLKWKSEISHYSFCCDCRKKSKNQQTVDQLSRPESLHAESLPEQCCSSPLLSLEYSTHAILRRPLCSAPGLLKLNDNPAFNSTLHLLYWEQLIPWAVVLGPQIFRFVETSLYMVHQHGSSGNFSHKNCASVMCMLDLLSLMICT